ncbi:phospholipid/cholesterol/gamma-HCH transport system permease protein [Franzmannia pantelleriensis]|uniref:Phospholipid/cholesterol/gamma-HCH transport system permease protein n=1 Tax=Franzmannia pantelleriensis TaxID=48727 RepID=A0A1G9G916_9GAMM|nr:ABC transporter permease [Halomonas pantelleriensis]SDK97170.1 phospholipid/cholesterol/gamma-HCH transport system permease protein [Halomonas pantelleriensis]
MQSDGTPGALQQGHAGQCLVATGDWTLVHYATLCGEVERNRGAEALELDQVLRLDTAGVVLFARLLGVERLRLVADGDRSLSAERRALLRTVCDALDKVQQQPEQRAPSALTDGLARIGQAVQLHLQNLVGLLGFIGLTLAIAARLIWRPRRWRMNALMSQIQYTGLNALPIVALLTFMIGAVVAFLGATVLDAFGASVYTVDLVAYSFMREFGVLLAAILVAGRTASAFTAQIGSMKVNEEIDALRVQGFDPAEWLVLPRVLALLITLPLLAFVGLVSGLLGGGLVALLALDIPLGRIMAIYRDVPLQHFLVGMGKAPLFAFLIAVIGCREGFRVSGSAESVGQHTTSSVVQSIFVVILVDALAALFFMEMGW